MDPDTSLEIGCTVTTIDNTVLGIFSAREENIKARLNIKAN